MVARLVDAGSGTERGGHQTNVRVLRCRRLGRDRLFGVQAFLARGHAADGPPGTTVVVLFLYGVKT